MIISRKALNTFVAALVCSITPSHASFSPLKETTKTHLKERVSRFNIHRHLTRPTKLEVAAGAEHSSRRLAANRVRLGIHSEEDRELVASNPPDGIVVIWDDNQLNPSEGGRINADSSSDPLPFGDGPGVSAGLPSATKAFWDGTGGPEVMWEVLACPVADVTGFLENPLSCVFDDPDSGLIDFFYDVLDDGVLEDIVKDTVVPLGAEMIYTFTGLPLFEYLWEKMCSLFSVIDDIEGIIEDIEDALTGAADSTSNWFKGAGKSIKKWFRKLESDDDFETCTVGHYESCGTDDESDCDTCLNTEGAECDDCWTCWKPLEFSAPDVPGLCLPTADLRDLMTSPTVSIPSLLALYTSLATNYMKDLVSSENEGIVEDITTALGADGSSDEDTIAYLISSLSDKVDDAESDIKNKIVSEADLLYEDLNATIKETCTASTTSTSGGTRKLENDDNFEKFLRSGAPKAREQASRLGLSEEQTEEVITKLFSELSGTGEDVLEEAVKKSFSEPGVQDALSKIVEAEFVKESDDLAASIVGRILQSAVDPETGNLNHAHLSKVKESFMAIRDNKIQARKSFKDRKLIDFDWEQCVDPTDLDAESICVCLVDEVTDTIKEFIETVLKTLLVDGLGEIGSFLSDVGDIAGTNDDGSDSTDFLMPLGFLKYLDPFSDDGLGAIKNAIISVFQTTASLLIYGCEQDDGVDCPALPSVDNQVLTVSQDRSGNYALSTGCNSEFEAELLWYRPIHEFISNLLGEAGESVLAFLNIPINFIKWLIDAATKLYDHMFDVCDFLDGYVQFAKIEATYENSRFALQELACRELSGGLQKGNGCDGIDNTCDDDKQIDECAEDIFPPDLYGVEAAIEDCSSGQIFPDLETAVACIEKRVSAVDDCKEVILTFPTSGPDCTPTVTVNATAQGCGGRDEDITTLDINVKVSVPGECELVLKKGYGCDGIDNDNDGEVDECDEDAFPPTINGLDVAIENCGSGQFFADEAAAIECVENLVYGLDECEEVTTVVTMEGSGSCTPTVLVTATSVGCGVQTEKRIVVKVDGQAPVHVGCSLTETLLDGNGNGNFENLGLSIESEMTDNCASQLDVTIEVYSNEVEEGEEMVLISSPQNSTETPVVYVQDSYCETGNNGNCKLSTGASKSRGYYIKVTATDEAGNSAYGSCEAFVGSEDSHGSPLFSIKSATMTWDVVPTILIR